MPYRTTEKTRQRKDAKRTAMMQAAVRVFAEKGYHAATVRDIVEAAEVAVGTFYFYFPDKESLFVHLFEETSAFLLRAVQQGLAARAPLPQQLESGIQAYVNVALYEPAVVQVLLVSGPGSVPALASKRAEFREKLIRAWQRPLGGAVDQGQIPPQNTRRVAEALVGAFDEAIIHLLSGPAPEREAPAAVRDLALFASRAVGYRPDTAGQTSAP